MYATASTGESSPVARCASLARARFERVSRLQLHSRMGTGSKGVARFGSDAQE